MLVDSWLPFDVLIPVNYGSVHRNGDSFPSTTLEIRDSAVPTGRVAAIGRMMISTGVQRRKQAV